MDEIRIVPADGAGDRYDVVVDGVEVLRSAAMDEIERYFRERGRRDKDVCRDDSNLRNGCG